MNPYILTILAAAALLAVFAAMIVWNNHRYKKLMRRRVRRLYGAAPLREYEVGDMERISRYFRRKCRGRFCVDDITWNDLEMDRVFMQMNQTVSSPGEDVLYCILRTPLFSQEELKERDDLIEFFATHQEEREQMQIMLSRIGKTKLGTLSDTILSISEAPKVSFGPHFVMPVLLLISLLVVTPISPLHGFLLFFVLSVSSITAYYTSKDRKVVDAYVDSFSSLLRMLSCADDMRVVKWPQVKKQMDAIAEGKKAFSSFRKKAFFLTGNNRGTDEILQTLMAYVRMIFHVDILMFNSVLHEIRNKEDKIMLLIDSLGELDACISIASYRELLTLKCKPVLETYRGKEVSLDVKDLYHPLLSEAVANSMYARGGTLITGSNASGKSTFLKNLALNSILAQTIGTCTCSYYRAPFFKVMTSMALRDDLQGGESYFIVEIKSLKRILDESKKEEPLLCIIDEVLRGTNTIERIAASSRILMELCGRWVLPFAATHDIELSYILDGLYTNYHFEEEVTEHQVVFNYLLQEGRATTRNAIKLLDMLGYDGKLVKEARQAAIDFETTGVWKPV